MMNPFRRRSAMDVSPPAKFVGWLVLVFWAFIVLFPLYWLFVTSFKDTNSVGRGPFYFPFIDFQPTFDAWHDVLVNQASETFRPYINTVVIGLTSATVAVLLGATSAYALVRFRYQPRLGIIGLFVGCMAGLFIAIALGVPWLVAVVSALAVFAILAQTIGRRFKAALGNNDIAFWLISQRILPPIAVVLPLYVLYQQVGLLDTQFAIGVTYVASNLPIAVWLMRDYFAYAAGGAGGIGLRRWCLDLPHLPVHRPAAGRAGSGGDLPDRAHLRLERVPHRQHPVERQRADHAHPRRRPGRNAWPPVVDHLGARLHHDPPRGDHGHPPGALHLARPPGRRSERLKGDPGWTDR